LCNDGCAQNKIVVHWFVSLLGSVANAAEEWLLLAEALLLRGLLFFGRHGCGFITAAAMRDGAGFGGGR